MENAAVNAAVYVYRCTESDAGRMIAELLRVRLALPGGTIRDLKFGGGILLNGEAARVGRRVCAGDTLQLDFNCRETEPEIRCEDTPLRILYEDAALLAADKPAGTVVHPTVFHQSGTLANALLGHDRRHGVRGGIHFVSRLDLGTSGLVLVARNGFVQESLRRQAENGQFQKEYVGVVYTGMPDSQLRRRGGTVHLPIGRKPGSIMEREVRADGADAVTHYRVLRHSRDFPAALLAFRLETGRTHQIRVHCLAAGFPLLGDTLYGGDRPQAAQAAALPAPPALSALPALPALPPLPFLSRQALHAARVSCIHPVMREALSLSAPLPDDLRQLLNALHLDPPAAYGFLLDDPPPSRL